MKDVLFVTALSLLRYSADDQTSSDADMYNRYGNMYNISEVEIPGEVHALENIHTSLLMK